MDPVEEEVIRKENFGEPLGHDPTFAGPLTKRSCTDVLCLLIFIAFIAGWVFVAVVAYRSGDPERLIYPTDSLGQRCGVDERVKDRPHLFFFDLARCATPGVIATGCPTPQVCIKKCPEEDFAASFYLATRTDLARLKSQLICKYDVEVERISSFDQVAGYIKENKCAAWYIKSQPLLRRCIPHNIFNLTANFSEPTTHGPVSNVTHRGPIVEVIARGALHHLINFFKPNAIMAHEFGERLLQDLTSTWHWILLGLAEAALLCLVYIVIMRWIAAPMIWLSLLGSLALLSYGVYACWERYRSLDSAAQAELEVPTVEDVFTGNLKSYLMVKETWLAFMIIAAVLLVVVLFITLALRNRLRIATELIREASKAVGSAMSSLLFPLVPWMLQLGVLAFGISVMLFLASSGRPIYRLSGYANNSTCICPPHYKNGMQCDPVLFDTECHLRGAIEQKCSMAACNFFSYRTEQYVGWMHAYNVLGLFWALFFISAFGEMVLAGTFATWYWTFKKVDLPFFTLTGAFVRTFRYHLGTLAFGSLIIAICRLIRVFLEWLDRKLKKYSDNSFVKGVLCCCKCCFWCLEKFLRFLNRNAYIMCAVHGKNFCTSAKEAFFLLMRNVVRVVVLDKITDFLLFLGKLLIVAAMVVQWFYIFGKRWELLNPYVPNLNYYMAPVIVIGLGSYFIAAVFFSVYAIAVDTLFLCFLEDSERNDGSAERPYYMSSKLMRILNKKNKLE